MHDYWIIIIRPLFSRLFHWYISFIEDGMSVKISFTEFVMKLQTGDCLKWIKKGNQTSAAIYEQIGTVLFSFAEHFLSHSARSQRLKTFFRFFYWFFIDSSEYILHIRVKVAGLFELHYWGCDCIAFALVIFPHWTKDTDR